MTTKEILTQAVTAKNAINSADTETKNKALANMADALLAHTESIKNCRTPKWNCH